MRIIAGVDEVGRGSLIGPVYAAAVILNKSIKKKLLKDSKSLTKSKREILSNEFYRNFRIEFYHPQTRIYIQFWNLPQLKHTMKEPFRRMSLVKSRV